MRAVGSPRVEGEDSGRDTLGKGSVLVGEMWLKSPDNRFPGVCRAAAGVPLVWLQDLEKGSG